jgi:membrane protein DedA with SNARE-associated domain
MTPPNSERQSHISRRGHRYLWVLLVLAMGLVGWNVAQIWVNSDDMLVTIVNLAVGGVALALTLFIRPRKSHDGKLRA